MQTEQLEYYLNNSKKTILKNISKYYLVYDCVNRYISKNNIYISGDQAITLIDKKKTKTRDYQYLLYCKNAWLHSTNIINILYLHTKYQHMYMYTYSERGKFYIYIDKYKFATIIESRRLKYIKLYNNFKCVHPEVILEMQLQNYFYGNCDEYIKEYLDKVDYDYKRDYKQDKIGIEDNYWGIHTKDYNIYFIDDNDKHANEDNMLSYYPLEVTNFTIHKNYNTLYVALVNKIMIPITANDEIHNLFTLYILLLLRRNIEEIKIPELNNFNEEIVRYTGKSNSYITKKKSLHTKVYSPYDYEKKFNKLRTP